MLHFSPLQFSIMRYIELLRPFATRDKKINSRHCIMDLEYIDDAVLVAELPRTAVNARPGA